MLVSSVQENDSSDMYMYIFFFRFFPILGCYKTLNVVSCAIQEVLVYLFCVSVNPKLLIYASIHPSLLAISLFSRSVSLFLFNN